jgi:phosphotriesterase-related protein
MKALEAASSASANTGAPVMIHSYHLSEEEFTTLLVAAKGFGMPYGRLIFSHFDTMIRELRFEEILNDPKALSLNLELGRRAMDLGSTLSFDLLGADWSNGAGLAEHNDVYALAAISQYVKEGYADRLVIGTDTWNRLSTRRFGGHGMSHLLNYIVPTLLKFGVSEQDVAKITTLNPARLLAF